VGGVGSLGEQEARKAFREVVNDATGIWPAGNIEIVSTLLSLSFPTNFSVTQIEIVPTLSGISKAALS